MKRRPLSLVLRLTFLFGIAAMIVFPIFGWIISQSTERHFLAEDASELRIIASAAQDALPGNSMAGNPVSLEQRFDDILKGHHHASLYIAGKDGKMLYASPGPDLSALALAADEKSGSDSVRQWSDASNNYRVLIKRTGALGPESGGIHTIVVAVPIDVHLRFLAAFHRTLWLMIATSIAIMSIMGWIAVRQGYAPLRDIIALIRRISANELNTRLPPDSVPAELTDLTVSVNEMLERVDTAFHRLSDFNADIAHELRTPITNLMTQTQVTLSRARTPDEYRGILYSNMEEYERMAQMVNDMLFLAQTDNRALTRTVNDLDLVGEVQALFDYYEGWAEECGVGLALEGAATAQGDKLMLRRALGNLLSNAIRHTAAGGTVRVELRAVSKHETSIVVENPGPKIADEHIPKLFDRFYRVDPSRQRGGAGLGLAITKSIVDAHGGRIGVVCAAGRTRFQITLPRIAGVGVGDEATRTPRQRHTRTM